MEKKAINLDVTRDLLSKQVVDCIFHVHKNLGPGLLESVYEDCLVYALQKQGLHVEKQKSYPISYDGLLLDAGLRADLVVDGKIILELKSVEKILPVHEAQILSYLKISGLETGFIINFNVPLIKQGIKRFVKSS